MNPSSDQNLTRRSVRLRESVREELKKHGLVASPDTDPALIREFLNDLYVYQLRRLRDQLLAGAFPRKEYAERVLALRQHYTLLSLPLSRWVADDETPGATFDP